LREGEAMEIKKIEELYEEKWRKRMDYTKTLWKLLYSL
jgi:hypothetical protein